MTAAVDPATLQGLGQLSVPALALGALIVLWRLHLSAIARERETTDWERARADRAEVERTQAHELVRDQMIPVLTRATDALSRTTDALTRATDALSRLAVDRGGGPS